MEQIVWIYQAFLQDLIAGCNEWDILLHETASTRESSILESKI